MHLLILFPRLFYERKMSMVRRHVVEHLCTMPRDYHVKLSGQGWPDWDDAATLRANIDRIMPYADAIFWYKPDGSKEVPALIEPTKRRQYAVASYNEAWWPDRKAYNECAATHTQMVICHHQNDVHQFISEPWEIDIAHVPHCAKPSLFVPAARPYDEREISVLVTGALSDDIYPLRTRIARLIERGVIRNGRVEKHPGYRLRDRAACLAQEQRYAAQLGNAKISVCCGSIYGYGLAKYAESAMAGCLIAGDMTPDYAQTLNEHSLALSNAMSDTELAARLSAAALNLAQSARDAAKLQAIARERLSTERYCDRMLRALGRCQRERKSRIL